MLPEWLKGGRPFLLLALANLLLYPIVGPICLLTTVVALALYFFHPHLERRAREMALMSKMREVALLFSANIVAVKSFEKALERTVASLSGELRKKAEEYLLGKGRGGPWAEFFSLVKEHVKSGDEKSIERVLQFYLKKLEESLSKALEETVNPVKVFLAMAILLPVMVMVAIPIFSMFVGAGGEEAIAYFFALLLPLSYGAFILYVKHVKPQLSVEKVSYPLWPLLLLPASAAIALLLPPTAVPFVLSLPLAVGLYAVKERVEGKPWERLHPLLSKMALYLQNGYSFERALSKALGRLPQDLPSVLRVVEESAKRSVREAGRVAERLAEMLEEAEEMERAFRERLEEVISTIEIVRSFVLPLVGGATLAFTLGLFEYIESYKDVEFFLQLSKEVNVGLLTWGFSLYIVESILLLSVLKGLLEGREGPTLRDSWKGLVVFSASFGVLYLFMKAILGA